MSQYQFEANVPPYEVEPLNNLTLLKAVVGYAATVVPDDKVVEARVTVKGVKL